MRACVDNNYYSLTMRACVYNNDYLLTMRVCVNNSDCHSKIRAAAAAPGDMLNNTDEQRQRVAPAAAIDLALPSMGKGTLPEEILPRYSLRGSVRVQFLQEPSIHPKMRATAAVLGGMLNITDEQHQRVAPAAAIDLALPSMGKGTLPEEILPRYSLRGSVRV
jgi:hypothetical protein